MTLHNFLPLLALILNVSLAGITLFRNPESRLNRLFTYFVGGMAVWNFGVFMLRRAPDETTAVFWESGSARTPAPDSVATVLT